MYPEMYPEPSTDEVIEKIRKIASKTKSKIAKQAVEEDDFRQNCRIAHMLLDEAIEAVQENDMGWKEAMEDLKENLVAMEVGKLPLKEPGNLEKDED